MNDETRDPLEDYIELLESGDPEEQREERNAWLIVVRRLRALESARAEVKPTAEATAPYRFQSCGATPFIEPTAGVKPENVEERPLRTDDPELGRLAAMTWCRDHNVVMDPSWANSSDEVRQSWTAAASAVERIVAARVREEERKRARDGLVRLRAVLVMKRGPAEDPEDDFLEGFYELADSMLGHVDEELAAIDATVNKEAAYG